MGIKREDEGGDYSFSSPTTISNSLPQFAAMSSTMSSKSRTYYGGEVITCLSSLLNQQKTSNTNSIEESLSSEILKFEFIGANVKLKKSNLLQTNNGKQMRSVNFVDTVVIKEYPSLDFILSELENEENCYLNYEKTLTCRLEQKMEHEYNNIGHKLDELDGENIILNKEINQRQLLEPLLDDVKATSTVNKMISKYKEMIESRNLIINGLKDKYVYVCKTILILL
jgi:hypothetical protein